MSPECKAVLDTLGGFYLEERGPVTLKVISNFLFLLNFAVLKIASHIFNLKGDKLEDPCTSVTIINKVTSVLPSLISSHYKRSKKYLYFAGKGYNCQFFPVRQRRL